MNKRLYETFLAWIVITFLYGCTESARKDVMVKKPWPVWDIAFSSDGRWLAAGRGYSDSEMFWPEGGDGEVNVWNVGEWKLRNGFSGPFTYWAGAVSFTPDSEFLVAASDNYIRLNRDSCMRQRDIWGRHLDGAPNPWGGQNVFVWMVKGGTLAKTFAFDDQFDEQHTINRGAGFVTSMALSPDGELISLARLGSVPVILNRNTGQITYLAGHLGNSNGLDFSHKGKTMVSGTPMRLFVRLYDLANGEELVNFDLKEGEPTCVRFSPDDKQIAVGVSDGSVRLLSADLSKQLRSLEVSADKAKVQALAFAAKIDLLVAATTTSVRLFEASSGKQLRQWGKADLRVSSVALSPDGKLLAVGYGGKHNAKGERRGGYVNIWDTATGRLVKKLD